MVNRLCIRVYEDKQLRYQDEVDGPVELGRQERGEPGPYRRASHAGGPRLIIARGEENDVSRHHARFEPLPDGRVRVRNVSNGQPIRLPDGQELPAGAASELALPLVLGLGRKTVRLQTATGPPLYTLPAATLPPFSRELPSARFPTLNRPAAAVDSQELMGWLDAAMAVLQSALAAPDSADFFDRAARAVVDMADLDSGQVLLLAGGEWQTRACRSGPRADGQTVRPPSRRVLTSVAEERRTYWEVMEPGALDRQSLTGVEAVVAAPILDSHGAVLGALYGERRRGGVAAAGPITEVEARLVELLARGVAAGLARLEQERVALAERVRFEQFFTPELARHLAQHPDLLQGRDTEVTILFADIRGFSRISRRLGPGRTLEWIGAVLDALSECVLAEGGVLVNYIGDELMAMWGAPEAHPDHARRACRAALAMLRRLPELYARWQATMGEPLALGIGVNTGVAQVGNTGSRYKFNYGALGNAVNLASRVQGATKYLKCPLLLTGATQVQLDASFAARRLGRVQVLHIAEAVELYELADEGRPNWAEARSEYERALALFESGEFGPAARALGNWRGQHPDDDTALVLLYRAVRCMVEGTPAEHPVWVLADK
jgi:adenylate cyclase